MPKFGRKKLKPVLIIISLLVLIMVFVFLFRSPVLIVTDDSFTKLYGPARLRLERIKLSRELFRRVIPVTVAESASEDLVSIAVEGASGSPVMALFPYRYLSGARYYKEKYPETPVFVVGGERPVSESSLTFVLTNTEEDLYRAGLCAALLAGGQRVVFFGEGSVPDSWEAFRNGLSIQNNNETPLFLNISSDYSSFSDVGCVVLAGSASKFIEKKLDIPIILFSWLDPAMTPSPVKLVFDDSPWALAADIFRNYTGSGGKMIVSSRLVILGERFDEKKDFRNIQRIVKEKLQKN